MCVCVKVARVRNRRSNKVSNEIMERFGKVSAGAQSRQSPRYAYGKVLGWRGGCVGGQCFGSAGQASEWANEGRGRGKCVLLCRGRLA